MKRRIRNEDQRESSSLPAKKRRQESTREEPCEKCGNVGIPGLMMLCNTCRDTGEHTYCARGFLPYVPPIWICEACRSSSRVLLMHGVVKDQMYSETTVVDRSSDPKISLNDMEETVGSDSSCEVSANVSSVIHQPLQPRTSPLGAKETSSVLNDSSHDSEQHQPKKRRTFQLMGKHITL